MRWCRFHQPRVSNGSERARLGFTLVELIAAILVLAILGAIATGKYFDHRARALKASEEGTVATVRQAISRAITSGAVRGNASAPATLDSAANGTVASPQSPLFSGVLSAPVMADWRKTGANVYAGPTGTVYTYDPVTASFSTNTNNAGGAAQQVQTNQPPAVNLTVANAWVAGSPNSVTLGPNTFVGSGYALNNGVIELLDPTSAFSEAGRRNAITGTQVSAGTFELQLDTRLTNYWNQLNYWQVYLVKNGTTMNLSGNNFSWGSQPTGTKLLTRDYAPDSKSNGNFYTYNNSFTVSATDAAAYDQIVVVMSGTTNQGQILSWQNVSITKK
ncbi:MAG: prepilin-type N-terminal cleavage/methylation domain-containing protein [Phycisphaerales bacterium]|nr:prepilin-type N-terminal cleavage/methylation domain-containing protein [Phycisphaerales bacterium]